MSRRGGGRRSESRRDMPSPPAPASQSGGGRGRARGGTGAGRGSPAPARGVSRPGPSPAPAVSQAVPAASAVPPTATASASASMIASTSSSPGASSSTTELSREVEQKLVLQGPPPASTKAIRHAGRPGYGSMGFKCVVRANHFLVDVAEKDLHHYDVSITPEVTSKKINRDVMKKLVDTYRESHMGGRNPAYDGRRSIFTAGPLPFESNEFVVKLDVKDDRDRPSGSAGKDRKFKVAIRFAAKDDMHHLSQFLRGRQMDVPQETIQALDVVLRTTPSERYIVVGRSFFAPELGGRGELGDGIEYWRGYYQSLRPTQMGLSLNIDVSARAFYEPILVSDFITKFLNLRNLSRLTDQDRNKLRKALKGIKVEFDNGKFKRSYKVNGISAQPIGQLTFPLDDNRTRMPVVQYFHEKYNIRLQQMLPAVQAGTESKPAYLPMELCKIVSGQRYARKLNERQVTALLRATCQRPEQRENSINQMAKHNNYSGDKLVHDEFSIQVNNNFTSVDARVLTPPMLKYHGSGREDKVEPRTGAWNMINKKMVNGGTVKYWAFANFSSRTNPNLAVQFGQQLIEMCISKGMIFDRQPMLTIQSAHPSQIEKVLVDIHHQCTSKLGKEPGKRLQLLIIILPDATGSYGKIKRICETELGIVSQCCQPKQAMRPNNHQYLENVALKVNVKVGGRNTVIEGRLPLVTDRPTIIFGADVTHPQPGEDSIPSIASVVASMDWPDVTKYRGLVSAQTHRQEIIQDLYKTVVDPQKGVIHAGMVRELLIAFRRATGRKPERIIFYRDGVSEGQFNDVLLYEMDAIRKACVSLEENFLPPVTFVVVQKRHHTRLFPSVHNNRNLTDKSGNILPGTVVDSKICHPTEFDFYLNSHAGIQGTSRPTHYHVLYDENRFSADAMQTLTNHLCYTYVRCTRSVSIVPPAYYAHLAAFRARYYMEDDGSSGGARAGLPSIMENVKDVMFYC